MKSDRLFKQRRTESSSNFRSSSESSIGNFEKDNSRTRDYCEEAKPFTKRKHIKKFNCVKLTRRDLERFLILSPYWSLS